MMANRASASSAATCREHTSRRRPVPPSRSAPMSQSLNQRWRERPRCPASRVTPGRRDGVVHAIVGRAVCRVSAQRVRQGETWRPSVCVVGVFLSENQADNHTRAWPRRALLLEDPRTHGRTTMCACTIACSMLVPCSASSMLFATLRPGRWPGLRALTTPARGTTWAITRWLVFRWLEGHRRGAFHSLTARAAAPHRSGPPAQSHQPNHQPNHLCC